MYYVNMVINFGLNKNIQMVLEEQVVWRDHKLF